MMNVRMPSPIGHALGGIAAAWAIDPKADRELTMTCAALAMAPDLDLLLPYGHRTITHSVGAVGFVALFAAAMAVKTGRPVVRLTVMCAAAYGSHLLLDWLGEDPYFPYGIRAFWPFTNRFVIAPVTIFRQTARRFLTQENAWRMNTLAVLQEIAILGPIVIGLWLVRVKALARLATEMASRHHPSK